MTAAEETSRIAFVPHELLTCQYSSGNHRLSVRIQTKYDRQLEDTIVCDPGFTGPSLPSCVDAINQLIQLLYRFFEPEKRV